MLSFVGSIISLVGWFGFHSIVALVIGTLFYVLETLIEWKNLNAGAKILDIVLFAVGSVVALLIETPFYVGGMVAVSLYSGVMSLLSLPMIIQQLKFMFQK